MTIQQATAVSPANIAFIKYWGVRDPALTLPYHGSLSMNLDSCLTTTTVRFDPALERDEVVLQLYGEAARTVTGQQHARVAAHLDRVRALAGVATYARVESENNFPSDAGIASSAAAFSALTVAAVAALGLQLSEQALSILTRRSGSGSACRSVPTGYVEWVSAPDATDEQSYAHSIAAPEHWGLCDIVAVVDAGAKKIGSAENHRLAASSRYFATRLQEVPERLEQARQALLARDLGMLGAIIEADAVSMHAVCMTSLPPSFYWGPGTLAVIQAVRAWREAGLESYFTIDAGPNVHVICAETNADELEARLQQVAGVQFTLANRVGAGARVVG